MPLFQNVRETTPAELARRIEAGEPIQVVDVRPPAVVATGRIEGLPEGRFHNITSIQLMARRREAISGLDRALPTAVICNRGNESRMVTALLASLGLDAVSVAGGMDAWMRLVVPRELAPPLGLDRLVQLDRVGKGALGYFLARNGEAVVVDPPRDITPFRVLLEETGARLVGVVDTHVHADYISGATAFAREYGVPYLLHPADAVYPYDGRTGRINFKPLRHGEAVAVGGYALRACHTPGHTLGSISLLAGDDLALTGDFLFVGSIGRPDLAGRTAEWAADLWRSLGLARREWPGAMLICPAHYAGERERRPDRAVARTFGEILGQCDALRFETQERFVEWVMSREAGFPEAYRLIKAINIGLEAVPDKEADQLETGRNECALAGPAAR